MKQPKTLPIKNAAPLAVGLRRLVVPHAPDLCNEVTKWNADGTKALKKCQNAATYFGDFNRFCTLHAHKRGLEVRHNKD